ncbi:hypothetical protein N9932_00575 [bacterium]|nr:hypothetical protein [Akkermansiaceae bacterium]MDB4257683.1 hypothetical protein [bacterium]MDB0068604.1 hypothetical protein [Akkermansiaceae bacterium]MDB4259415.1 hypothetical protein [Akkermansiaceae bacterium]MDB4276111.1 hypothetical protein [Akkermansiaceae bacterium]
MRTLLLGDIGNRMDIADAENQIAFLEKRQKLATRALTKKEVKISVLQAELERQRLATTALSRFLIEKGVIEETELEEFIREVDAEDGVVDGKLAIEPNSRRLIFKPAIPEGTFRPAED